MSKKQTPWRWHLPLAVQDVPEEGRHHHLVAEAPVRAGIAGMAGVPEILRLEAEIAAVRHGADGLRVTGHVSATVAQTCVVTLEPMQSEIDEEIDVLYLRHPPEPGVWAGEADDEPGKVGDERIEALADGAVDLGAIATEFLILGIDPYPRKADAVFAAPPADEPSSSPFAALAALKKAPGERGG
jgi:uncharacterized metal-binding protein YceD (DUF177 family)